MNWRTLRTVFAMVCLLGLSLAGLWGLAQEWRYSDSFGRIFSVSMQSLYSVLGLAACFALYVGWCRTRELMWAWGIALLLTGATAPVIWSEQGWTGAAMAFGITGACALLVVWLVPLPATERHASLWHWFAGGFAAMVALAVIWTSLRTVPVVVAGKDMEQFCRGMRSGVTRPELVALSQRQGYGTQAGKDSNGEYLRVEDPASGGHYYCEARFKPDGDIASMEFQAKAGL